MNFTIQTNRRSIWENFGRKLAIGLLLGIVLVSALINNAKAQCNAVMPFLCITTAPTSSGITSTSANISITGAQSYWQWLTGVGVVWSTTTNPTTASPGNQLQAYGVGVTMVGSLAAFTINSLTAGTTYYLRPYALNSNGDTYYGTQISFTTTAGGPIAMTTDAATGVTSSTATTGGTATITGGVTIVERGVVYATATNPTTANTKVTSGSGAGAFVTNLTGLASSTTYYVRSYSIDNNGVTYYGPNINFTTSFAVSGIVSPFSLSPSWEFGFGARYTFPSGSYPAVPPGPVISNILTNTSTQVETSTGISFRNGSPAVYTNTMQAYNAGQSGGWSPNIRNFSIDNTCGGSATGGGVAFPDPANNATNDAFYVIIANDITSGGCAFQGSHRYRFTGTGTTVAHNAGPDIQLSNTEASEAITAGTDGYGGYWVVMHDRRSNNNFYVWHYAASGAITGPVVQTPATTATVSVTGSGGYLKFSPCMDKIAFAGFSAAVTVYEFDKATGTIGNELGTLATAATEKVGLEFSPDGTKIYYSGQGSAVKWFEISNPTNNGTVAGASSWTMQMGPDAQIYTSGPGNISTSVGVITNPNSSTPGHTPMTLVGSSSTYRGISNIAWLSPQLPQINFTNTVCNTFNFSMLFKNYFNDNVTIKAGTYAWDFGDGSAIGTGATPTHTYPSGINSYTVTLTFRDEYCNTEWTATTTVNTTCVLAPLNWLSFEGNQVNGNTILSWITTNEVNTSHFEIYKSLDGITYSSIGIVSSSNQAGMQEYGFVDDQSTGAALNYYYVKQIDINGTSTQSNTIALENIISAPSVSPNPSSSNFTITLPGNASGDLMILDVLGRELTHVSFSKEDKQLLVGHDLAKGAYIVVVSTTKKYYIKVIKE